MTMKEQFDKIDLQWFGDPAVEDGVPDLEFEGEEEEDDELEIYLESKGEEIPKEEEPNPDADLPEEIRGKSRTDLHNELQALKGQANTSEALTQAVEKLGEKLSTPQRSTSETVKQIKKTLRDDPQYAKRFNEEVFKDDPFGVIMELVEKVSERVAVEKAGQMVGALGQSTAQLSKQSIINDPKDGPIYKAFETEVNAEIQRIERDQPGSINNPGIHKFALDQVKLRNIDKIAEMKAEAILEEKGGKRKKTPTPKAQHSERGNAPAARSRVKEVKVAIWEEDLCYNRGLDVEEYARMKSEGIHFDKETLEMVGGRR